jgi:hypothetical protein
MKRSLCPYAGLFGGTYAEDHLERTIAVYSRSLW